jgi:hypothetical protein
MTVSLKLETKSLTLNSMDWNKKKMVLTVGAIYVRMESQNYFDISSEFVNINISSVQIPIFAFSSLFLSLTYVHTHALSYSLYFSLSHKYTQTYKQKENTILRSFLGLSKTWLQKIII